MKANRPQLDKALKSPAATRLFLFYGADESGSRALAKRVESALGPGTERVVLSGGDLKADPARLADEAASISMFGDARFVLVEGAGDESLPAVESLLQAEAAGNAVALISGALKPTSKLLKLALASPQVVACASYLPDAKDWNDLVSGLARPHGLIVRPDIARRVAEACGANRAVIDQEMAKFALFLGADPSAPQELGHDALDAVGAALDEGDTTGLVDALFAGQGERLAAELARLASEGAEGIALIRPALRRALMLVRYRAQVEQGESIDRVLDRAGKALFWKEKDSVARQLGRWRSDSLARVVERLNAAERDVKAAGSLGPRAADETLFAIARRAARSR